MISLPLSSVAGGMFRGLAERANTRGFQDPYEASAACYAFLMECVSLLSHPSARVYDPVETAIAPARYLRKLRVKLAKQLWLLPGVPRKAVALGARSITQWMWRNPSTPVPA